MNPDDFKRCLRRFASGITVVTVATGEQLHGMTASSFASVSLDPPLVLVCLDRSSATLGFIKQTNRFAINILGSGQEETSRYFSRRGPKPFDAVPHFTGPEGSPLLEGVGAWMECTTHQLIETGDHHILIGRVEACETFDTAPLIYFDGSYRSLP